MISAPHTSTYELLSTKLALPRLHSPRVRRRALLARLDAGMQRALTLVSAPAGFGKTTLILEWVAVLTAPAKGTGNGSEQRAAEVAWVSLDAGDNEPLRFWSYVFTAARGFAARAGDPPLDLHLALQQPHPEAALTAFINSLSHYPGKALLVLEDYHLITNPQIHRGLTFLLEHIPPALHLVLLTRGDPPLPLARLRARNEVNDLRAPDLRFDEAETRDFLRQALPNPLSPQIVDRLFLRSEGWPAGLRLMTLALQGRDGLAEQEQLLDTLSGSHRPILEFLIAEVLAAQPETIQEFLLEISFLSRLNGSLCSAVTGREDGARLLAQLEKADLFLEPLDGAGEWYRFHGLFAEAMRYAAGQKLGEPRLRQLALKASRWYEGHSMTCEAVETALLAQDYPLAADLIERVAAPRLAGNEYHTLLRWIQGLPEDVLRVHPRLCLTYAQALLFASKNGERVPADRLRSLLDTAEQAWTAEDNRPCLGEVLAFRALMAWWQSDFARAFALARQALDYLPHHSPEEVGPDDAESEWQAVCLIFVGWEEVYAGRMSAGLQLLTEARALYLASGNAYGVLDSTQALAEVHARLAEPHQAAELYRRSDKEIERAPIDRVDRLRRQARSLAGLAALAYERNDLQTAEQDASRALALGKELNNEELQVGASWVLARVERARGDLDSARRRFNSLAAKVKQPLFLSQVRDWQAWLALSAGDLAFVRRWSARRERRADRLPLLHQEQAALILARAQIAGGEAEAALTSLQHWLDDARTHGRTRSEMEIYILIALAQAAAGREPEACQSLSRALALAQPEHFLRVYLDEGPSLAAILQPVAAGGKDDPTAARARELLLAFYREHSGQQPANTAQPSTSPLPGEPLSPQEERVLRLLAAGYSNGEIAQELIISINTVKTHIKSIYRKLGVNTRRAARETARGLNLVA